MPRYLPEPTIPATTPSRTGVLMVNLGSPDAPTAAAVRPYLKQFLSDPRVVEIPRPIWWLILNGIILNIRPAKSAAKYATVWTPEGSPLRVWTEKQAKLVKGLFGELNPQLREQVVFEYAMRYGNPSIASKMNELKQAGCEKILFVPMYPQYAASTTASVTDEVVRVLQQLRRQPTVRFMPPYYASPLYIDALAHSVQQHWQQHGRGDHLLMSFHGVPEYTRAKGDPYYDHVMATGRKLAQALQLSEAQYTIAFQSRFGKTEWLKPYTSQVLQKLGNSKTEKLDVICPGFAADCLETLEEIAQEGKHDFQTAGGGEMRYIACLNDNSSWINALTALVSCELTGWLTNGNMTQKDNIFAKQ